MPNHPNPLPPTPSPQGSSPEASPRLRPKHWWNGEDLIVLILLGLLFLLPGLGQITLFDRDEPRFASAARDMVQSGDFVVPTFDGNLRPDKPPLIYWLMSLSYNAMGGPSELAARLPSAIAGIGTLLVIYFMVGSRFGRLTGIMAALMMGTCALFLIEARMATADSTMLFFITVCMACAWQAWDTLPAAGGGKGAPAHLPRADYLLDRTGDKAPLVLDYVPTIPHRATLPLPFALLFWIALAAGVLTKGVPLIFVLVPMVILSLATGQLPAQLRQWRSHFHLTRGRVGLAFAVAGAVIIYEIATTSTGTLSDTRVIAAIVAALLCGMLLTPGLPGILARCLTGGNWRWWRQLRPLIGVPLLLALVLPWFVIAGQRTHWVLIQDMVGVHFLNRVAGPLLNWLGIHIHPSNDPTNEDSLKAYGQPPGFYLAMVWATFWPWSILLVPAAYHAFRRLLRKTPLTIDPRPYQFLLAWIIPMWILLELSRGKLLHYPLPLYVPLAILCADTLVQSWYRLTDVLAAAWFRAMRWITLVIWMSLGVAVLLAARRWLEPEWLVRCLPFAAALMAVGLASVMTWGRASWPFAMALTWGGALLCANILLLPTLPPLQVSRTIGQQMADARKDNPKIHLAARGYQEGTLVFYAGSDVEMFNSTQDLSEALLAGYFSLSPTNKPDVPIVVAVDDKTLVELDAGKIPYYRISPIITGVDTGNFKPVSVTLITNVPPAITATMPVPSKPATTPATTATSPGTSQ